MTSPYATMVKTMINADSSPDLKLGLSFARRYKSAMVNNHTYEANVVPDEAYRIAVTCLSKTSTTGPNELYIKNMMLNALQMYRPPYVQPLPLYTK